MNVEEFLSDLGNDELSDMFIGNRDSVVENRAKLFPLMNKAMTRAYAKYQIAYDTEELVTTEDEDTYTLVAENVLAVDAVINVYGRQLSPDEVQILGSTLVFPVPAAATLQVSFKTKPVRFTVDQVDVDTEIVLPELLICWMASWVAAYTFLSKADEHSQAKGTQLLALAADYETTFQATNTTNEFTKSNSDKLCARGFA